MTNTTQAHGDLKKFLNENQYSLQSVLRYERIFGQTFVSHGGESSTKSLTKQLKLKPNERVLDVGCGMGGSAFYLARMYKACIVGIDLSSSMIEMALRYHSEQEDDIKHRVSFELDDVTKKEYEPESFDVIYSRETFSHIENKKDLFAKFLSWLKPGGQLFITDTCRGNKNPSQVSVEFQEYIANRGYHLLTLVQYESLVSSVGFQDVKTTDMTRSLIHILNVELKHLNSMCNSFVEDFSQDDFDEMVTLWKSKIQRCSDDELVWMLMLARKV